jgi:hypothetical protein
LCALLSLFGYAPEISAAKANNQPPIRRTKLICDHEGESCKPLQNPYDEFDKDKEIVGSGPHVLLVTNGQTATKFLYKTGPECLRARSAIKKQIRATGVIISVTTVVCVPQ